MESFFALLQMLEAFGKNVSEIKNSLNVLAKAFAQGLREIPVEIREGLEELTLRGWYLHAQMPGATPIRLKPYLHAKDEDTIDKLMSTLVEHYLDQIQIDVKKHFPKRARILDSAFLAHYDEKYELSIPVFLAQADGICAELLGEKLYSRERGTGHPKTKKAIEELQLDKSTLLYLVPLLTHTGISASEHVRNQYPGIFNRHEILHGIDCDYPTKVNSLKAISVLGYLSTLVRNLISKRS